MAEATVKTTKKPTEDRAWSGSQQARITAPPDPSTGPPDPPAPSAPRDGSRERRRQGRRRRERGAPLTERKLPLKTRVVLSVVGGLLVILGIAGLFLPFLQGILFLVLGGAVLSLTSHRFYGWLYRRIGDRWPGAWEKLERFRTKVRWKLR